MVVKISEVKPNPNNPRLVKDTKFTKLVQSIKDFPKMLELRPIVVNDDMVVLGGNMRLKACKEAGLKEVPIIKASDLTEKEQREFIIKDNLGYGEWDWEMIANEWNEEELNEWGLDVPIYNNEDLTEFFKESIQEVKEETQKIVLNYTLEEYELVKTELLKHGKTYEDAVYKLLGL